MNLLPSTFFGKPTGIAHYLWKGFVTERRLWLELGYTILGTSVSFVSASVSAIAVALLFTKFPKVRDAAGPYLAMLNAMPRIALVPLFLLWFGLGLGSKVAVGFSLAFFIVLSATMAGINSVHPDYLVLSRTLGATPSQIFRKVTLPSAVPVMFSGLRLALVFSLLGVVGAELIAAEHGLGQTLAYLQATFDMNGLMAILFLLGVIGMAITVLMSRLERALLDWQ
jgi:NitT/TauT family transport system permease protein